MVTSSTSRLVVMVRTLGAERFVELKNGFVIPGLQSLSCGMLYELMSHTICLSCLEAYDMLSFNSTRTHSPVGKRFLPVI